MVKNNDNQRGKKRKNKKNKENGREKRETTSSVEDDVDTQGTSHRENPLYQVQQELFLRGQTSAEERTHFFDTDRIAPERRAELWMAQADLGSACIQKYAWATPNETAWRVLQNYSPLIEIGCGANAYWCRWMMEQNKKRPAAKRIDIIGFDLDPRQGGKVDDDPYDDAASLPPLQSSFQVHRGGPKTLAKPKHAHRTLFLCYPDEEVSHQYDPNGNNSSNREEASSRQSMAEACLEHYQGDIIIHVGELITTEPSLSLEQAPWGRSTSASFQQALMAEYHCLLQSELPNWLHTRDSLTVWKRSKTCTMVFAGDDDDDEEDEEYQYRHVPPEERLPANRAAPCLQHLLEEEPTGQSSRKESQQPQDPDGHKPTVTDGNGKKRRRKEAGADGDSYVSPW